MYGVPRSCVTLQLTMESDESHRKQPSGKLSVFSHLNDFFNEKYYYDDGVALLWCLDPTSMDSDHDVTLALAVVAANDTTERSSVVGRHGQNHGFLGVLNTRCTRCC